MLKRSTYKYKIQSNNGGIVIENADPLLFCEKPPYTASVVWDLDYKWDDAKWMENRKDYNALDKRTLYMKCTWDPGNAMKKTTDF
jgi:1,4-alpha-glucan branching enzyme